MPLPLLITVKPKPGESLNSLLARAACANVVERPSDLLNHICSPTLRPDYIAFTKIEFTDALAQLLSIEALALRALFHPAVVREKETLVDWYGTPLPRCLVETEVRRYSPGSLRRAGYHRAQWMIRPLEFCSKSLEFLKSDCPKCGATLGWKKTLGITVCEYCGGSLKHHRAPRLSPEYCADAVAAAQLVSPLAHKRRRALRLLPAPFFEWEPGDAFVAVLELATIFGSRASQESSSASQTEYGRLARVRTPDFVQGYRLLRGWPDSINDALSRILNERPTNRQASQTYLHGIRSRSWRLPMREIQKSIRQRLPDVLLAHGISFKPYRDAQKAALVRQNLISGADASAKYGIRNQTIARLKDKGRCVRATLNVRRGVTLFDDAQLKNSILAFRANLAPHGCCRIIGVPLFSVEALANVGLVDPVTDHDALLLAGTPLYESSSVRRLAERLLRIQIHERHASRAVSVFRRQFHPETCAEAVRALLDGRLRIVRRDDNDLPVLKRLWVDEIEATEFATSIRPRARPEGTVSCAGAGPILGLHEVYVEYAFRTGLLDGTKVSRQLSLVTLSSLLAFDRAFISGPELAAFLNINPKTIFARTRSMGFQPVGRLYKLYLWKRTDGEVFATESGRIHEFNGCGIRARVN